MSANDVERELERMFWPEAKRPPKEERPQGISAAMQLLMTSERVSTRGRPGDRPPSSAPVSGGLLLRAELRSHLNRAPQVLVKITGKSRGIAGVRDHLRYIGGGKAEKYVEKEEREFEAEERAKMRDGRKLVRDVVTETGERIDTQGGLADLQAEWRRGRDAMPWAGARAEAFHILYQMPAGTDERKLLEAVQATAAAEFDGHRYAMALHVHQSTPHVHLIVRAASDVDGRRLNPRKADLHRWRMRFAHELRERGVDAAASRQRTRGYAQRHSHIWEMKMDARSAGFLDRAERARRLGDASLADELEAKAAAVRRTEPTRPRPESETTRRQVQQARERWDGLGRVLGTSANPADRELGRRTLAFVRQAFDGKQEPAAPGLNGPPHQPTPARDERAPDVRAPEKDPGLSR